MKNQEQTITLFLIIGFVLFWFIIPLFQDISQERRLHCEGRYTIGNTIIVVDDHHSSPLIKYSFKYKGTEYQDFASIPMKKPYSSLVKKRFFVLFLPSHPTTSKILIHKPAPIEIKEIPFEGWKEIPE